MNIYVGNLSYNTSNDDLKQAFESYGEVTSAAVIMDKISGRSKGFGFVEMANKDEAEAAISGMNGKELSGRTVRVNEAQPKPARSDRRDFKPRGDRPRRDDY